MIHSVSLRVLKLLGADPAEPTGDEGRWPTSRQALLWDLVPEGVAPSSDGVVSPTWSVPDWVASVNDADVDDLIATERRRADGAQSAASTTEGKAARLLGTTVTLLTASVALTALQLRSAAHAHDELRILLVVASLPGALACLMLFLSALRSLDADTRVGVYGVVTASVRASGGKRAELERTTLAASRSEWTSRHKASALMDARAWFSRALLAVLLALCLGSLTVVLG